MAVLIANKDGTSSGKPGDTVITGGGIVNIAKDGTKTVTPLPGVGTTKNYETLKEIANAMTKPAWLGGTSGSGSSGTTNPSAAMNTSTAAVDVFDSPSNYDDFTSPGFTYDPNAAVSGSTYSYSSGGSFSASKIVGYGIVGLVLIAVLDRLLG